MPTYTFAPNLWLTPDSWGVPSMLTWPQLTELCLELGTDPYTALPYIRLGEEARPIASAWYHRLSLYTQDGRTRCAIDCIRVDTNRAIIGSAWGSSAMVPTYPIDSRLKRRLLIHALSR